MPKNQLENLFNYMKNLNYYPDFSNYQEYKEKKLGISKKPAAEDEKIKAFNEWKNSLSEEERQQFEYVFGS